MPRSNEGKEQDSIAQMGKRLAFELIQYCKGKSAFDYFFPFLFFLLFFESFLSCCELRVLS
jgi:hypothetical protein